MSPQTSELLEQKSAEQTGEGAPGTEGLAVKNTARAGDITEVRSGVGRREQSLWGGAVRAQGRGPINPAWVLPAALNDSQAGENSFGFPWSSDP